MNWLVGGGVVDFRGPHDSCTLLPPGEFCQWTLDICKDKVITQLQWREGVCGCVDEWIDIGGWGSGWVGCIIISVVYLAHNAEWWDSVCDTTFFHLLLYCVKYNLDHFLIKKSYVSFKKRKENQKEKWKSNLQTKTPFSQSEWNATGVWNLKEKKKVEWDILISVQLS